MDFFAVLMYIFNMKENIDIFKSFCRLIEAEFNCRLCLHDYAGMLAHGELPHMHLAESCICFKETVKRGHLMCIEFDQRVVHRKMQTLRRGFFKLCHCGILEGVFPVYCRGTLAGMIFAGPFAPGEAELSVPFVQTVKHTYPALDERSRGKLLAMGEMLASYLGNCCTPVFGTDREGIIKDYLLHNAVSHTASLDELAEKLELSPARASETVKRIFGKSFSHLLNEERLRIAGIYLDNTDYPLSLIAEKSGFSDGTYFHRVFKKFNGKTPGEYRKKEYER